MPQEKSDVKTILCFVCNALIVGDDVLYNRRVNLPVCKACEGSDEEKHKADDLLKGLADGFVCGCI
ncbi:MULTISPECIES: hypothetical protein [unclassified Carboxylicivirga]|uniref:hypothetical protein n=1 Tax=Carboxylicivirga TaxID=1628153 RepID=UPI003D348CB2